MSNLILKSLHGLTCMVLILFGTLAQGNQPSVLQDSDLSTQAWKDFNTSLVSHYVMPAYNNLDLQAHALHKSITQLCQTPINSDKKRQNSQLLFHSTMDAWQYIQNIQFGPIQTLMRNYSMQFWPDKKNHVGKHLAQFLNNQDQDALSEEAFRKASVSIKGLPAIERFLFDQELNQSLLEKPFNCQVLMRISSHIAQTSTALNKEWQEMATEFSHTMPADSYFEDDIEASTTLLKALIEPIEIIRDLKLLRPLGSEYGQQKAKRLESWRSQRSLRNIEMNLQSLADFYKGAYGDTTSETTRLNNLLTKQDAKNIEAQFDLTFKQLNKIQSPIEVSIETSAGYQALSALSDSLKLLHEALETAVNNRGIHLGFNSRDGD